MAGESQFPNPVDWRERSGVKDGQTKTPPIRESSTSEGDMRKGSYRSSAFPRLFLLAVSNDDGTPIGTRTEELLEALIDEIVGLRADLAK